LCVYWHGALIETVTDDRWNEPRLSVPMTEIAPNHLWTSDLAVHNS
jgi:hypothetical protein